jgi:ABC-type nickel/cobalt efflux system permease component RcnA
MRRLGLICLAVLIALIVWLWGFGGADIVSRWATATQRDVQNAMARSLRALQAGEAGALLGLWGLCLTYGFVHAAGPGHGKLVIGGYGVAARVAATRLVGLAVLSSLAQALMAVVMVYVAIWALGWGRTQMTSAADEFFAPLSYALIIGVGAWLFLRGLRHYWQTRQVAHDHSQDDHNHNHDHHHHGDDGVCSSCGHAHAPTPEQAAQVSSVRDAIAVIAAIAIRPCTGAVFLLILTHALGVSWAGITGAFVMGIGTAAFTGAVALASVGLRESTLAQVAGGKATARVLAMIEVLAGGVIATLAIQLLLRSL